MLMRTPSIRSQDDPLALALLPPPAESESDRQIRLKQEAEARRISDRIDEELKAERKRLERSKDDVKVRVCARWLFDGLLILVVVVAGTSRIWQIHTAETIPADVQSRVAGERAHVLAHRYLL